MKREWVILVVWILIFILIRSLHFTSSLNFSQDQASDSLFGMELLKNHQITLIGTHTGYNYHGRLLFQGPLFIYTYMFYNFLGGFNPVISSYIFMLTGALGIIPLYFGIKRLASKRVALFTVATYTLLPYYINYTKFMWNPNFQFILTPFLVYFFSRFKVNNSLKWLFTTSTLAGLLLQNHYQFVVIIFALGIYILLQRLDIKYFLTYIVGVALGFSPVLLFEVRNSFYNLNTAILYLQNFNEVFLSGEGNAVSPHFFLSISLIALCVALVHFKKYINKTTLIVLVLLLLSFSTQYLKAPDRMYNSSIAWKLEDELKVYSIIKKYNLKDTNVSHLDYDNEAIVQKYFLKRDKKTFHDDYYQNRFLFAVSKTGKLDSYRAYEISTFTPRRVVQTWPINSIYTLYLLERTNKPL